jgi:hypothetical protein
MNMMSGHVISKIGLFLFLLVAIAAMTFNFLETGRLLPINIDLFLPRRTIMDDDSQRSFSCPTMDPPTTDRTKFGLNWVCFVYCYPSTGGVLIKEAGLLDMLFLSLPRSHVSQRSPSADEEDKFCNLLRRTGATWWRSKEDRFDVLFGIREPTAEEEKVMVFGWPTDGLGVWVLRYESEGEMPRDFGRMSLAMNMEEKIEMMREYGATFVENSTQVEELHDTSVRPPSLGTVTGTYGEEL